ncbi:MAG: hypothetical protein R6V04_06035 [bacterium]
MSSVIIAVHGLKNKPPKKLLARWWKKSILHGFTCAGLTRQDFPIKMAYWADILHGQPLNPYTADPDDPDYLYEPFVRVIPHHSKQTKKLKKQFLTALEKQYDRLFLNDDMSLNFSNITESIITRYFSDLAAYYRKEPPPGKKITSKQSIRKRLVAELQKHRHKDILLLSHSMGSIIAYDVLTLVTPDIKVHTWITFGSPIGLPVALSHAAQEQKKAGMDGKLSTPENVQNHWFNFSDLDDNVALNWNLVDDFLPNSRGVHPVDITVTNMYEWQNEPNPHKSFGYLQTAEIAEHIHTFLEETSSFLVRLKDRIKIWIKDIFST